MFFYGKNSLNSDDKKSVIDVLKRNNLSQGYYQKELEKNFRAYTGAKYAIAVSSGTTGLHLAIESLNLKANDVAVTSNMTFVATVNACIYSNIKYNVIDIDKNDFNIDILELEKSLKRNKNIKLIIPVHFGGLSCKLKEIHALAKKYSCYVIEDASQAMGANYKNYKIGSCNFSDLTVFSLHPVKTITGGEGGIITTNNLNIYKKILLMRSHGLEKGSKYPWQSEMITKGFNYRITEFQCALANSQLKRIDKFVNLRKKIYEYYVRELKTDNITFQFINDKKETSFHLMIMLFNKKMNFKKKLRLYELLKQKNITFAVQYLPVNQHKYFRNKIKGNFTNSKNMFDKSINIPIYPDLNRKDLDYIIQSIKRILNKLELK